VYKWTWKKVRSLESEGKNPECRLWYFKNSCRMWGISTVW